jgi:hypothetical protein
MTKLPMILMLTFTILAAPGCYAHAGYYAEPMNVASTPAYVMPTAGYRRPCGYGYSYERPGVYMAPRPAYFEPHPVYHGPVYAPRVAAGPAPYRAARATRGYRR